MLKLALLACLSLATGASTPTAIRPPIQLGQPSLEIICADMERRQGIEVDCSELDAPYIVTSGILNDLGYGEGILGLFRHGDIIIFVSPNVEDFAAIVVHETVHYVIYWLDLGLPRCDGEKLARAVSGGEWNERIAAGYSCPVPSS